MLKEYLYREGLKVYEGVMHRENKAPRRKWTKHDKFLLGCVTVLWLFAAVHLISDGGDIQWLHNAFWQAHMEETGQEKVVSAFGGNIQGIEMKKVTAGVNTYAKYSDTPLTEQAKEEVLRKVADVLGIEQYTIEDSIESENHVKTLSRMDDRQDIICKLVTVTDEDESQMLQVHQYLYIGITLSDSTNQVFDYEKCVRNLLEKWNMDSTVAVHFRGQLAGNLSQTERDHVTDILLAHTKAKRIMAHRSSDLYTVYAYDKTIVDFVRIGSHKVNINISMNYDEQENVTNVYYATPIQMSDY